MPARLQNAKALLLFFKEGCFLKASYKITTQYQTTQGQTIKLIIKSIAIFYRSINPTKEIEIFLYALKLLSARAFTSAPLRPSVNALTLAASVAPDNPISESFLASVLMPTTAILKVFLKYFQRPENPS